MFRGMNRISTLYGLSKKRRASTDGRTKVEWPLVFRFDDPWDTSLTYYTTGTEYQHSDQDFAETIWYILAE